MKKMKFFEDKYYNLDIIYQAGQTYEVEDHMVDRWLKRGGVIVEEVVCPVVVEASQDDLDILGVEPEKKAEEDKVLEAPKKKKFKYRG
jgi:hypothetical protein